jgi:hypothetical protein
MADDTKRKEPLIFISYTRRDVAQARELYKRLKEAGYKPWMDLEDLIVGDKWELKVRETMEKAPLFISCLSNYSVNHEGRIWWEIREALEIAKTKIDIYFLPVRLDECEVPPEIKTYHYVSLYEENGFEKLLNAVHKGMRKRGIIRRIKLRSKAEILSDSQVEEMLKRHSFSDKNRNWSGMGLQHQYVRSKGIIKDYATGLTWQQSGSEETVTRGEIQEYIQKLNDLKFAGHSNWRLPTLEEAMSLVQQNRNTIGGHQASIFDMKQRWIWTSDKNSASLSWYVDFFIGVCSYDTVFSRGYGYVRAVR